jgi:hypothetical protein
MLFAFVAPCFCYLVRGLLYTREQTVIGGEFPFEFSLASFFPIFMDSSDVESVGMQVNADIESQSGLLETHRIP